MIGARPARRATSLARKLTELRRLSGKSQESLALSAGWPARAYMQLERGTFDPERVSLGRWRSLASALDVALPQILELSEAGQELLRSVEGSD